MFAIGGCWARAMWLFSERLLGATGFASFAGYQRRHCNSQMDRVHKVEDGLRRAVTLI